MWEAKITAPRPAQAKKKKFARHHLNNNNNKKTVSGGMCLSSQVLPEA
jgi:hypothetical protein